VSVILFAHGARDREWALPLVAIRDALRSKLPNMPIDLAFLELMEPNLATVIEAHARLQPPSIEIVPLFFAAGSHLKNDLPTLVTQLQPQYPSTRLVLYPPVGALPAVQSAMATAIADIVSGEKTL
jgi:sirohydrochlorin cobaltochelatase